MGNNIGRHVSICLAQVRLMYLETTMKLVEARLVEAFQVNFVCIAAYLSSDSVKGGSPYLSVLHQQQRISQLSHSDAHLYDMYLADNSHANATISPGFISLSSLVGILESPLPSLLLGTSRVVLEVVRDTLVQGVIEVGA